MQPDEFLRYKIIDGKFYDLTAEWGERITDVSQIPKELIEHPDGLKEMIESGKMEDLIEEGWVYLTDDGELRIDAEH